MKLVGIVCVLLGAVAAALLFFNAAPEFLVDMGWPLWAWLALAGVGVVVLVLTRRPAD